MCRISLLAVVFVSQPWVSGGFITFITTYFYFCPFWVCLCLQKLSLSYYIFLLFFLFPSVFSLTFLSWLFLDIWNDLFVPQFFLLFSTLSNNIIIDLVFSTFIQYFSDRVISLWFLDYIGNFLLYSLLLVYRLRTLSGM